jgi:spore maturation protein CgeB
MSATLGDKILYAAPLCEGSSSEPRLVGLRTAGLTVVTLDTSLWWHSRAHIVSSLAQRAYCTKSVLVMNRRLLDDAKLHRPDVIWIDKGCWVYPATVKRLREYARFLIGYCTDDLFARTAYMWLYRRGIRHYDLYLTTNRFNVLEIPKRYGVKTLRAGMGYDQNFQETVSPALPSERNTCALLFVGHWEPHTENYILALRRAGIRVDVWGHLWGHARAPELRYVRPLSYPDYCRLIARASIALCFLSRANRNESTMRSYEITGVGTFMLAERTDEHEYLFGDGVGAALFSSNKELVEKASYYLNHASERKRIADTGRSRCQELDLSWQEHMQREWPIVRRVLEQGIDALTDADDHPFWPGFREGESVETGTPGRPPALPTHKG